MDATISGVKTRIYYSIHHAELTLEIELTHKREKVHFHVSCAPVNHFSQEKRRQKNILGEQHETRHWKVEHLHKLLRRILRIVDNMDKSG